MINGYEIIVLLVIIAVVVGPERLPAYAKDLAALVRRGRELLRETQDRVSSELGDAGEDVDWAALDPRRYDPRRIVRDALRDDPPQERASTTAARRTAERRARAASAGAKPSDQAAPDQAAPDQPDPDQAGTDLPAADQIRQDQPSEGVPSEDLPAAQSAVRGVQRSPIAPPVFDDEAT